MRTILDPVLSKSAGEPPFPEQGDWFVLHTRSRQEKAVARQLKAMRIGCYLPIACSTRHYGARRFDVETPLFPSYVFMRGALEDAYAIDRRNRIASIIPVPDQGKLDDQLRSLDRVQMNGVHIDRCPFLAQGMLVEVRSGPFRGLQGIVDLSAKYSRLILQVDVLGQAASLEIDAALLEPILAGREN